MKVSYHHLQPLGETSSEVSSSSKADLVATSIAQSNKAKATARKGAYWPQIHSFIRLV